jgi:hypothetical protein
MQTKKRNSEVNKRLREQLDQKEIWKQKRKTGGICSCTKVHKYDQKSRKKA